MPDKKIIKLQCVQCKRFTNHSTEVTHAFTETAEFTNANDPRDILYENIDISADILRCMGCDSISFKYTAYADYMDEAYEKIYPSRNLDSRAIKTYPQINPIITNIYRQTIDAFNANLNILCGIGLRAI